MKKFFFLITLTVFTLGSCASINDHCGLAQTDIDHSNEQQEPIEIVAE
ncbi:hypothetical protein N9L20_06580 [Flavobacteriaceae bacterium]|nr:hypothetical protein [Flavobacteriaceae bacterium]